jgi:CheY-like chemotaxis protein
VERLASGSGQYAPFDPADPEDVARIARDLQTPIYRLRQAIQALAHDSEAGEVPLLTIHESLLAISRMVRELCFTVLGAAERPRPAKSSVLCGAAVLIAGEDPEQIQWLSTILREEGIAPVTAMSAPECLVRVTAQQPEAVIADLALGTTLANLLAVVAPHVPMIVTTAGREEARDFANTNAHVLDPPVTRVALLGLLETVLLGPSARIE